MTTSTPTTPHPPGPGERDGRFTVPRGHGRGLQRHARGAIHLRMVAVAANEPDPGRDPRLVHEAAAFYLADVLSDLRATAAHLALDPRRALAAARRARRARTAPAPAPHEAADGEYRILRGWGERALRQERGITHLQLSAALDGVREPPLGGDALTAAAPDLLAAVTADLWALAEHAGIDFPAALAASAHYE